jgi:predicted PhzF superfamily epimerase YddE/YHI9
MSLPFTVDAFTDKASRGSAAAVIVLPSDYQHPDFTQTHRPRVNFSETAFVPVDKQSNFNSAYVDSIRRMK